MRRILSPRHRGMLSVFARSNALVAFDFDGTLAPIVRNPDEACMRPQTKTLLKRLCSLYPCMVISGRSRLDVRSRLRGTALRYVIGNHGAELGDTRKLRNIVSGWKALLAPALAGFAGVWIEDKQLSLAIHYRQSSQKVGARKKIFRLAQGLRGAKLIPAKQALNVIPKAAPHKGMALETLRTKLRCDTALYVGDDETDEDVFSLKLPEGFLGIRVGVRRASLARFCLYQQSEIDDLLRLLAELRESSTSGHGKLLRRSTESEPAYPRRLYKITIPEPTRQARHISEGLPLSRRNGRSRQVRAGPFWLGRSRGSV